MRAVTFQGPGEVAVEERPEPEPAAPVSQGKWPCRQAAIQPFE